MAILVFPEMGLGGTGGIFMDGFTLHHSKRYTKSDAKVSSILSFLLFLGHLIIMQHV